MHLARLASRFLIGSRSTSQQIRSKLSPQAHISAHSRSAPTASSISTLPSASASSSRPLTRQAIRNYSLKRLSTAKSLVSNRIAALKSIYLPAFSAFNFDSPWHLVSMAAAAVTTIIEPATPDSRWYQWSWRPTSASKLESAERAMLACLKTPFELRMVDLPSGESINTLKMGQGPPLVMIHGFGGGLALFAANLEHLAQFYTVYAIDLPGFGRSSRPMYLGTTPVEAESYFVGAFDLWMDAVGLDKAIVMGHSLGAFLSASWAISHPHRFERLILVDPFGVPQRPNEETRKMGFWRKMIIGSIRAVSSSPLTLLRAAGPWGPGLIKRLRPDLLSKFEHLHENSLITADYIYHVNAQSPASGEVAFTQIMSGLGYAADPLINRLPDLDTNIPVSFIYGEESWMNPLHGVDLKESMPRHTTDFFVIGNAGHHVYVDQWNDFNNVAVLAAQGKLQEAYKPFYKRLLWAWQAQKDAEAREREQLEEKLSANAKPHISS